MPDDTSTLFGKVSAAATFVRDVGLIIGIPTLIIVGMKLYEIEEKALEAQVKAAESQVKILEQENTVLKETQYDHALSLIDGQKKVFEIEMEGLEKQIADLKAAGNTHEADQAKELLASALEESGLEHGAIYQLMIDCRPFAPPP